MERGIEIIIYTNISPVKIPKWYTVSDISFTPFLDGSLKKMNIALKIISNSVIYISLMFVDLVNLHKSVILVKFKEVLGDFTNKNLEDIDYDESATFEYTF